MIDDLKQKYEQKKGEIVQRLAEFRESWTKDENHVFAELCFCLLTPQSKAKSCWRTIEKLKETGLLYSGTAEEMKAWMASVRFNESKSKYIVLARQLFSDNGEIKIKEKLDAMQDVLEKREWLVKNVKGFGMKEASHFLRNVGFGDDIAILDRHILKNLARHGVIEEAPNQIPKKKYMEIEKKMKEFSIKSEISMAHLDLLWWSEEAGEIFK